MAPAKGRDLTVKQTQYISLPLDTLLRKLLDRLGTDVKNKTRFIDFVRRVEHLYRARISRDASKFHRGFDLFCGPESHNQHKEILSSDLIEQEEDIFLQEFHRTMLDANFEVLSQDLYDDAQESEFTLNVDLKLQEKNLDPSFLTRLINTHEEEFGGVAELNKYVLVYHRGCGLDKKRGLFIMEKVDFIFGKIFSFFLTFVSVLAAILMVWRWPSYFQKKKFKNADLDDDDDRMFEKTLAEDFNVVNTVNITRKSLSDLLEQSFLSTLFSKVTLQEPTFKEIVVLYRTKAQLDHAKQTNTYPKINVKGFKDIPRADFEVVLPEQKPVTRSFDLFKVLAAVAVAISTIAVKARQVYLEGLEEDDDDTLLDDIKEVIPVLAAVGTYASKVIVQLNTQQRKYRNTMIDFLFARTTNTDIGVRAFLEDSTIQQEVKEAILAYFFLWKEFPGTFPTINDLDKRIEVFLRDIGEKIDFEVDDAVYKLLDDGFIKIDSESLMATTPIRPKRITRVITQLDEMWKAFYTDPNQPCPFCPYLDHHGGTEDPRSHGSGENGTSPLDEDEFAQCGGEKNKNSGSAINPITTGAVGDGAVSRTVTGATTPIAAMAMAPQESAAAVNGLRRRVAT